MLLMLPSPHASPRYNYSPGETTIETTLIAAANHTGSGLPSSVDASQTRKTRETFSAVGSLLKSERFDSYENTAGNTVAANWITVAQNNYDGGSGVLSDSTDANGQQTDYDYDPLTGLVSSVTKPNGETTTFEYDSAGNRTRLHYTGNPAGGSGDTRWIYDALGRVSDETVVGVTAARHWSYQGFDTFYTDRNGVVHQTRVSPALGLVEKDTSAAGMVYERIEQYASSGDLISVEESLDEGIESIYASRFVYDHDLSDLNSTTLYELSFGDDDLDHSVSIDLDTRGQIDQRSFAFKGLEPSATDLWSDDFDFDWLGRETARERTIADLSGDIASIWNDADEPQDKQVQYGYNVDGSRTAIDRFDASYSSGTPIATTHLSYTPGGMIETITHSADSSSTFFSELSYGYDPAARLRSQSGFYKSGSGSTLRVDNRVFTYDAAGQLTEVSETIDGGTTQLRNYSGGRSSTSADWSVGIDNRLSQDDRYDYEYSGEGQLTKRTSRQSATLGANDVFVWDPAGRLIRVIEHDTSSAVVQTIEYGYDANGLMSGRRVLDANATVTSETGYLHEGLQRVVTLDLSGLDPVITELSLHGTQPNEVVATDILASGVYVTSWNFTDNLGSLTTVASLDQSNWKVVHRTTAEYGGDPHHLGDTAIAHLTSQSIWAGHHYDPDTGLLEAKARWYDPESGRFISKDPMGFAAGDSNLYRYVGNGPGNAVDPNGLYGESMHFSAVFYVLRAKGWSNYQASSAAYWSQFVDHNPKTSPWLGVGHALNELNWLDDDVMNGIHFWMSNEDDTVTENPSHLRQMVSGRLNDVDPNLQTSDYRRNFGEAMALANLGIALHSYLDTWSHQGYSGDINPVNDGRKNDVGALRRKSSTNDILIYIFTPKQGHAEAKEDGHYPDNPYNMPFRAIDALKALYDITPEGDGNVVPWSVVESDIAEAINAVPLNLRGNNYDATKTEESKVLEMRRITQKRFGISPTFSGLHLAHFAELHGFEQALKEWYHSYHIMKEAQQ